MLHQEVPPLQRCVDPRVYVLAIEPHAKMWSVATWIVVYGSYVFVLSRHAWVTHPHLSVLSQAILMSTHAPLLDDLGFTWYLLASLCACVAPLVFVCVKGSWYLCRGASNFSLPSVHETSGIGFVLIMATVQAAVTGIKLSLQQ